MLPSQRDARSASEYPKSLAAWLELDYFRRPRPLRRVRRLVTVVVLVGCALAVAGASLVPGSRRIYQAAPVSTAHALFNDDCEACHSVKLATATRLLRGDDSLRSVRDESCLRCHAGDVHHPRQSTTPGCASCHREHRDRGELARVDDGHCTSCHADLKGHSIAAPPRPGGAERTYDDVAAFLGGPRPHPEFAASRSPRDPGTIRFNHRVHMDPAGLLVAGSLERRALGCNDCHRPDAQGRYMEPVRYRQDCAGCHPLSVRVFDAALDGPARVEAERFRREPAPHPEPHETAETVRAVLRDRYLEFARAFPSVYDDRRQAEPRAPIVGKTRRVVAPAVRHESEWAERQLAEAGRLLFDGAAGCRYCHREAAASPERRDAPPRWEPSGIPARWMPHSRFSHDSHRSLDCRQCHAGAGESRQSADVLMPGIASCRECHRGGARGARADCVECHGYHPPARPDAAPRSLTIDDFLKGHGPRPSPRLPATGVSSPTRP